LCQMSEGEGFPAQRILITRLRIHNKHVAILLAKGL
jgi:hypothetical protein